MGWYGKYLPQVLERWFCTSYDKAVAAYVITRIPAIVHTYRVMDVKATPPLSIPRIRRGELLDALLWWYRKLFDRLPEQNERNTIKVHASSMRHIGWQTGVVVDDDERTSYILPSRHDIAGLSVKHPGTMAYVYMLSVLDGRFTVGASLYELRKVLAKALQTNRVNPTYALSSISVERGGPVVQCGKDPVELAGMSDKSRLVWYSIESICSSILSYQCHCGNKFLFAPAMGRGLGNIIIQPNHSLSSGWDVVLCKICNKPTLPEMAFALNRVRIYELEAWTDI